MGKCAVSSRVAAVAVPARSSNSPSAGGSEHPWKSDAADSALVLGLPGQSPEPRMGLQVMDKMQGEILQGDICLLSLTTSAE